MVPVCAAGPLAGEGERPHARVSRARVAAFERCGDSPDLAAPVLSTQGKVPEALGVTLSEA